MLSKQPSREVCKGIGDPCADKYKQIEIFAKITVISYINDTADSRNYVKFCDDNEFLSEKGHRKSSAEIVYRYITKNLEFEEAHTALADTEIEAAILVACLKRHKKLHTNYVGQAFRHPVWRTRCKA